MNMMMKPPQLSETHTSSEPNLTQPMLTNTVAAFSGPVARQILQQSRLSWRAQALAELEELLRLERGWDGYRAGPVSLQNVVFALQILESIANPRTIKPHFIPGTSGDLQMEWHTSVIDLEIHVRAPYDIDVWFRDDKTDEQGQEFHLTNDFQPLLVPIAKATRSLHSASRSSREGFSR